MSTDPYYTTSLLLSIVFHPVSVGFIVGIIAILILLFCSAIFSGSEVSFFSLTPSEIQSLQEKQSKNNNILLNLLKFPDRLLATLLIGNNFVNIGIVIIFTYLTNSIADFSAYPVLGFVIQVILVTLLILFFGEIMPKVYATRHALKFALVIAYPISFVGKLLYPLSYLLINSTSAINKRLVKKKQNISINELSHALELASDELNEEKEILEGIVKFGNIDVKEIMKSRVDVVSVDFATSYDKLLALITSTGYSRIPIFEDTFDNIKGILYVKDLIPYINSSDTFQWQQLIREPYFIPETKKINDLMQEFQKKKIHMAIVIDEYGGASGVVTLEDILEEIVGEINDEYDKEESNYVRIDDHNYIFEGKVLLNDLCKILQCDDMEFDEVKGDADTVAGLILELTGTIPQKNEKIVFKNYIFLVVAADNRRVKKVKVTIKKKNNPS